MNRQFNKSRFVILFFVLGCIGEIGCNRKMENPNEIPTTQMENVNEGASEQLLDSKAFFEGRGYEEIQYGNESAQYCHEGMVCQIGEENFFVNSEGNLIRIQEGNERLIVSNVAGGLNFYNNRLYYISSDDQQVYSVGVSGENQISEIDEPVYSLLICDKGLVYTDRYNHLYLLDFDKNKMQISDKNCVWENYYGEWLIYTEINESKSCPVKAFHLDTKEEEILLDYGIYPTVYDSQLFYQNKDGKIEKLDLETGTNQIVTYEWGQKIVLIGDNLFFTNGDCIYEKKLDEESKIIYESADVRIERMWEFQGWLIFVEKGETDLWKGFDLKTEGVKDYEDIEW